jgi:hypothetical protein
VRSTQPTPSRLCGYRICDRRFPFLWATAEQPAARWHGPGEGPAAYLSTTAKGAWAEALRHEHITELADVLDLEASLWAIEAPAPQWRPQLPAEVLVGDESSYPACQAEARLLRAGGAFGLRAPTAALLSGRTGRYQVDPDGVYRSATVETETVVVFSAIAPGDLVGMPLAEGHAEPGVLADVRHL